MNAAQLESSEYHSYYSPYIAALGNVDLLKALLAGKEQMIRFINMLPENKLNYSYAEGKWTVSEVIMHLIDAERVFQYRALRFGRNDSTALPGFDQDHYVPESGASKKTKAQLLLEFNAVRDASIALFTSFSKEVLKRWGTASNAKMSVRALGFVISGHQVHHLEVLRERYLN